MNVQSIISSSIMEDCQEFKKALTPLLELGEVEEWDGRALLEREKKIRELALILAGKCIAKLLEKLSKSREVQEKALKETRGWWRKQTAKKGSKTWTILTVGNVKITLNLPYVVERKSGKENKKKTRNQGFCPFLRWLGLEKRVTPLVWSTIAEYGTMRSSFDAAQVTLNVFSRVRN